jgi:hypothetical protein
VKAFAAEELTVKTCRTRGVGHSGHLWTVIVCIVVEDARQRVTDSVGAGSLFGVPDPAVLREIPEVVGQPQAWGSSGARALWSDVARDDLLDEHVAGNIAERDLVCVELEMKSEVKPLRQGCMQCRIRLASNKIMPNA